MTGRKTASLLLPFKCLDEKSVGAFAVRPGADGTGFGQHFRRDIQNRRVKIQVLGEK